MGTRDDFRGTAAIRRFGSFWRNSMKKWFYLCLIGALCVTLPSLRAQEKTQEKPKTEEQKPSVPVKVQVVLAEFDGDKKISSMPYTFMVIAGGRHNSTYVRTGVRVPV